MIFISKIYQDLLIITFIINDIVKLQQVFHFSVIFGFIVQTNLMNVSKCYTFPTVFEKIIYGFWGLSCLDEVLLIFVRGIF